MNVIIQDLFHLAELIGTWVCVIGITAPIVWAVYCMDKRGRD